MLQTPVSKYFWEINRVNIPISLVLGVFAGPVYGLLLFCSVGIFFGRMTFHYFKSSEYYMYYNLGYTKGMLLQKIFFRNLYISFPLIIIFSLI